MKKLSFRLIGIFLALTLVLILAPLLNWQSNNVSFSDLIWLLWPVAPFAVMALITWAAKTNAAVAGMMVVTVVAALLGVGIITDVLFIHVDPQGPIAILLVPAWQLALLIVVGLPLLLALNLVKGNRSSADASQAS